MTSTAWEPALRVLENAIAPGETIRWTGAPPRGIRLRRADALAIPFSLLWGGFAIFWEVGVLSIRRAPVFMAFWGIPFVLIGLYFIVGRFFADAALRANTRYALTDGAAYIVRTGWMSAVRRYAGSAFDDIEFSPGPGGSGTIRFKASHGSSLWGAGDNRSFFSTPTLDRFEAVPDARDVYAKIVALQRPS